MEKTISESLLNHLKVNIIHNNQHGFLKKKSTCTQLLKCYYDLSSSFDHGKDVDVIYVDFEKAFDTVSHPKLLLKLHAYGVRGPLLNLFSAFYQTELSA